MRMRQSLAQFEAEFREQMAADRVRRARLREEAAVRSRARRAERVEKHGTARFVALVFAILATAVIVTVVMFETLALLMS